MFGEHAAFIIPSYLISFLSLGAAVGWIWLQYKLRKPELERLEADNPPGDE